MLILLRLVFGAALLYQLVEGASQAAGTGQAGDLTGAWYLMICVGLAILNALVWAPYLGEKVSGPLTGMIIQSTYVDRVNWVLRLIRWLDARGYRLAVTILCFLEGIRHPSSPGAFVMGLKNARKDTWLEKVYAREVFRFNNTQNSVQAYLALKRHGIDPRPHRNQEVNIILLSLEKPPRPEAPVLPVPVAPQPAPLKRNPQIRLFRRPETPGTSASGPSPEASEIQEPLRPEEALALCRPAAEAESSAKEARAGRGMTLLSRLMAFMRVS